MRALLLLLLAACAGELPTYKTPEAGACAEPDWVDNAWLTAEHTGDAPDWPEAEDLGSEGYAIGDTVTNFRLADQNGDEVCAWQFEGRTLVIDVSALDCAPCQEAAKETACTARDFGSDDFVYLTIMRDHLAGETASAEDVEQWVEYFEIDEPNTPVVYDPGSIWSVGLTDNPPAFMVVDPTLTITGLQYGFSSSSGDADLRALIAEAAGTDAYPNGEDFCHE